MIRSDADQLIAFLDSLAQIDPVAMGKLIRSRVPCNENLAKHPTVQTGVDGNGINEVGILGIINGYVGIVEEGPYRGWGMVAAIVEKDGRCTGFKPTVDFDVRGRSS